MENMKWSFQAYRYSDFGSLGLLLQEGWKTTFYEKILDEKSNPNIMLRGLGKCSV